MSFIRKSIFLVIGLSLLHCSKSYDDLYRQAIELKNQGDYEGSRKVFEKAAEKKETPEVFKEIGNYHIEYSRQYDKAEIYLLKSLKLNSSYPNSLHNMGLIYLKQYEQSLENTANPELLKTADEWLSKNLKLNPDFALTYAEYGMVLFYKKNYNEAIKNIETAIAKGTNKSYGRLLLGKVYYLGFQNYAQALDNFNIAYNDFSKDSYLLRMMALTHKKLNQIENAHTYYKKYIKSLKDSGATEAIVRKAIEEESRLISG